MAGEIRAGDGDRNTALERLGSYFAEGYLTVEEFDERSGRAAVAATQGELAALFIDLPEQPGAGSSAEVAAERELDDLLERKRRASLVYGVLWAAAIAGYAVAGLTLGFAYAWLIFVLVGFVTAVLRKPLRFSEQDEQLAKDLEKSVQEGRAERLRKAAERRRELGQ